MRVVWPDWAIGPELEGPSSPLSIQTLLAKYAMADVSNVCNGVQPTIGISGGDAWHILHVCSCCQSACGCLPRHCGPRDACIANHCNRNWCCLRVSQPCCCVLAHAGRHNWLNQLLCAHIAKRSECQTMLPTVWLKCPIMVTVLGEFARVACWGSVLG